MYQRIVAGTDLSKTAKRATDRAAALASGLGAELHLVHAGDRGEESLRALAQEYGAEAHVVAGNPAEVLIGESERLDADLLVVGSVGMSGARRFLLGNVPNKVSHHATRDLLIVKTDPPSPAEGRDYRRVLVGTDGSATATRAVEAAAELAARLDLALLIVCAYEPPTEQELAQLRADPHDPVAQWGAAGTIRDTPEEFRWRIAGAVQAQDVLDRAVETAAPHVNAEVRAVEGHPAEALISIAEQEAFDLIVVGSVGMSGARRLMLGNVPHRISHHATTDILVLKTT